MMDQRMALGLVWVVMAFACEAPLDLEETELPPECTVESDCADHAGGPRCVNEQCVECVGSEQCDSGRCFMGACVAECAADFDCAGHDRGEVCWIERGLCTECQQDIHCAAHLDRPLCSSSSGQCEPDGSTYQPGMSGQTSYITNFTIPYLVDREPECCKDYGDLSDGNRSDILDNSYADYAATLTTIGTDLWSVLELVYSGCVRDDSGQCWGDEEPALPEAVLLLDHRVLEDGRFHLIVLQGAYAGSTTYSSAVRGEGVFTIEASSFNAEGLPQAASLAEWDAEGRLSAAFFEPIVLKLPLSGQLIFDVPVRGVELTALGVAGNAGISYTEGTLSGYVRPDDVFVVANREALSCSCLNLDPAADPSDKNDERNLFYYDESKERWASHCPEEEGSLHITQLCPGDTRCQLLGGRDTSLGQMCSLATLTIPGLADLDLDSELGPDAISIGLQWSAAEATIE